MTGTPCQDRTAGFVRGALAGVVLCDGAGSCAHSERAAQRLMEWIPDYLQITFDTLCALPPEEAAATVAAAGQAALEVLMGESGFPDLLRKAVAAAARRSKELGG